MDIEKLKYMGWSVISEDPIELKHEDGSIVTGNTTKIIINSCMKEYDIKIQREQEELALNKISNILKDINLDEINGHEIIDFLNSTNSSEIYKILPIDMVEQSLDDGEYSLYFTCHYDGWENIEVDGCCIIIKNDSIEVFLSEEFDDDEYTPLEMENSLLNWLKKHEFKKEDQIIEDFKGKLKESYDLLNEVEFRDNEKLSKVIDLLNEAKRLNKSRIK